MTSIYVRSIKAEPSKALIRCYALSRYQMDKVFFDSTSLVEYLLSLTSIDNPEGIEVSITLGDPEDWQLVRAAWDSLQVHHQAIIEKLTLSVNIEFVPTSAATNLLIDLEGHSPIPLQNKLAKCCYELDSGSLVVVVALAPLVWTKAISRMFLSFRPEKVIFRALRATGIRASSKVFFLTSFSSAYAKRVPREFWKALFASALPSVFRCDDLLEISRFKSESKDTVRRLFIFPERMLPLERAFFSRGFDVLLGLNYAGKPTNALIFGPNNADLLKIKESLEIVSPEVYVYPLIRGTFPWWHKLLKKAEKLAAKFHNTDREGHTLRFVERCWLYSTARNKKIVSNTLMKLPDVTDIVFTGAWFAPVLHGLMTRSDRRFRLHCDTHDVFFVLDRDSNRRSPRYFYSHARQRKLELGLLKSTDTVIAISEADKGSLEREGCLTNVIVESGSFEHARIRSDCILTSSKPFTFGFIGSKNLNNAQSIKMIREVWWPNIRRYHPEAKLLIAGGACNLDQAKILESSFPAEVRRLGFVDDLSSFYSSVSIMLSPISVQGGLNFKSVEALMAGKPLFTNELGSRCLPAELFGIFLVSDNGDNLHNLLHEIGNSCPSETLNQRIVDSAMKIFSNNNAYSHLVARLAP